jgi:hypothetical protein
MAFCTHCQAQIQSKVAQKFCNRRCAAIHNNGIRSTSSRKKQGAKLKAAGFKPPRKPAFSKIKFNLITGEMEHSMKPRSYWSSLRATLVKTLASAFAIPLCQHPLTSNLLDAAKERIRHLYEDCGYSTKLVGELCNIDRPDGHIPSILKALGIPRRTSGDTLKLCYANGTIAKPVFTPNYGATRFKTGYHSDWQQNLHFYRSSYELAIYEILDGKKKNYETESLRIKYYDSQLLRIRTAIPDILIGRLLIEIKSTYFYDPINMLEKFAAYRKAGYRPILILEGKVHLLGENEPNRTVIDQG